MRFACVLVTHLRAKVEMERQPQLKDCPVIIVDRSSGRPLVADHFPAARGVIAGMTLEQALSRQGGGSVLEADEAAYRRVFHRMLTGLQGISDRVEDAGLGYAYVGLSGMEAMYGGEVPLVNALLNAVRQELAPRAGVGDGKFPAFVAARTGQPLEAVWVPGDAAGFLAPHPVDLLPIPAGTRAEMRRLGLHTLGQVAAMSRENIAERFGPAGGRAWELSRGVDDTPLVPLKQEESIVERVELPFSSASMELLFTTVDSLIRRAYARAEMRGRYPTRAVLVCLLCGAAPWDKTFNFKQTSGDWRRASRIIRGQLESDHPMAPVEEVNLVLSQLSGESGVQLGLLPEVRHDLERRLAEAERQLQARMGGEPALHRVVRVAPWHPAPEMRAMRIPIGPARTDGMRPLTVPSPVTVREGPDRQPTEVLRGDRWQRVARIEDLWCFDLWWMPQPMTRTYYRVEREDGGEATLFLDHREDRWFRQAS